jgi:hypothetical protein
MSSLADIASFRKWATVKSCVARWQVFALHNLAVAIETTSTTDDLLKNADAIICISITGKKITLD